MSTITRTVTIDGTVIEEGSIDAVRLYRDQLREGYHALVETTPVSLSPSEVHDTWLNAREKMLRKLSDHLGNVERFLADYERHDIEWAAREARFRKEL